jgi:hypothetical protein
MSCPNLQKDYENWDQLSWRQKVATFVFLYYTFCQMNNRSDIRTINLDYQMDMSRVIKQFLEVYLAYLERLPPKTNDK